jgi:hypothetical protein
LFLIRVELVDFGILHVQLCCIVNSLSEISSHDLLYLNSKCFCFMKILTMNTTSFIKTCVLTNLSWYKIIIKRLTPPHLLCLSQARTYISIGICHGLFYFNYLTWEVIVRFVDISGIVYHHCLNFLLMILPSKFNNRIGSVMVSVLASSVVDRGFEPRSGQTKDYKIGICCFSAKHTSLRRNNKDWLVRNQNNVSEWDDMS